MVRAQESERPTVTFIEQQANAWREIREQFQCNESPNGPGSTMRATGNIRRALPAMLRKHKIRTMLDAPCGDWNWLQHTNIGNVKYTGWDVDQGILDTARQRAPEGCVFDLVNLLTVERIPSFDLIMCRDFTIHLPTQNVVDLLAKFAASGSKFLLTTNYPAGHNDYDFAPEGHDGRPGYYANPWNLEAPPFSLPGRVDRIAEDDGDHEMVLFRL